MTETIALYGFGEAGQAFARGWARPFSAYDLRSNQAHLAQAAQDLGGTFWHSPADTLRGKTVVFCLVTADQALAAAQDAAPHLMQGALWLDGNSCAPNTKRRSEAVIAAAGGRYVDLAIMAPVQPRLHRTPGLLSGPHVAAALAELAHLNMDLRSAGAAVGDASAIKMLRSVMIKGFEALSAECLLAARQAGVEDGVLASLQASDPGWDWRSRGAYNLDRMMLHGARRASEMREVAAMLRDLGLPDRMSLAAAQWQDQVAGLNLQGGADDLAISCDRILSALK